MHERTACAMGLTTMRWLWRLLWTFWPRRAREDMARLLQRGRAACAAGNADEARRALGDAVIAAQSGFGPHDPRVVEPLNELIVVLCSSGRFEEAEPWVPPLLAISEARGFPRESSINTQQNGALVYWRTGKLRTSMHLWERVAAATENDFPHVAINATFWLALGRRWLLDLDEARALASALPQDVKWGPARSLLLGRIAHLEHDYEGAIAIYEAALAALPRAESYRAEAAATAGSREVFASRLAASLALAGRPEDAAVAMERALRWVEGTEARERLRSLSIIRFDQAELEPDPARRLALHEEALEARRGLDGENDPSTLESRVRVATLRAEAGRRDAKELRALRGALDAALGPQHPFARAIRAIEAP